MEPFELSRGESLISNIDSEEGGDVVSGHENSEVQSLIGQGDIGIKFDDVIETVPF